MTWSTFYLVCFVVGLAFSVLSVAGGLGKFHVPARWHVPHFLGHHSGPMFGPRGHLPVTSAGHTVHFGTVARGASAVRSSHVSLFNFSSIMAFLAWFGGTGFLLTRYSDLWTVATFAVAMAGGLAAAAVVFLFLVKVLLAHETELDPADFDRTGVLGKVNVSIRAGGTGEIVFSQAGSRHAAGARSEDGRAVPKGTEVIITRYEKGIAYVRSYDDMAGESDAPPRASEATRK